MEFAGSNQIQMVFDPEYEQYVKLEGYEWIGHYYLNEEDYDSGSSDNE